MESFSPELTAFLDLLDKKQPLTAMLAPSFPIDFDFPQIIGQLKRLGFSHVIEVSRGAINTNIQLLKLVQENPRKRFITSPCPTIVRLIRNKYPQLKPYLSQTYSPMVNSAKLVREKFPEAKPVFIGPCIAKKLESREDFSQLDILVLTYKEIKQALEIKKITNDPKDLLASFDITGPSTRLYPVSGGLAQSSDLNNIFTDEEYDVVSGPALAPQALENFPYSKLKVLDILWCDGGCIAGPGINNQEALENRREKVISYWAEQTKMDTAFEA